MLIGIVWKEVCGGWESIPDKILITEEECILHIEMIALILWHESIGHIVDGVSQGAVQCPLYVRKWTSRKSWLTLYVHFNIYLMPFIQLL